MLRSSISESPLSSSSFDFAASAGSKGPNQARYRFFKKEALPDDNEDMLAKKYFDPVSSKLNESERLRRFDDLMNMLAPEHVTKLRMNVEPQEDNWTYVFSLNDDILYQSGALSIGHGQDLALFQKHVLLQNILAAMRSIEQSVTESNLKSLHSIAKTAELQSENDRRFLAKTFESMASIVSNPRNEASVALNESRFQFKLGGGTVLEGEVPSSSALANGVTLYVQMTMSALRLGMAPVQRVYANFLAEFKSGQFTQSTAAADSDPSSLSLLSTLLDLYSRAKVSHIVDQHQNTFRLDLDVKEVGPFSVGIDRDVKVRNFKSLGKAIKIGRVKEREEPVTQSTPVPTEQELRQHRMKM